MRDEDKTLRFILAGRRLSGGDHDRIIRHILRRHRGPHRHGAIWLSAIVGAVAAFALAMGLLGPRSTPNQLWLAAKGNDAGPILYAHCLGRPPGYCRRGDKLLFETDGARDGGFFAAYAELGSAFRIWYFPTADGHLATISPSAGHSLLREVANIGDEHRVGHYDVHLFVLERATDRATLLDGLAPIRAEAAIPLDVIP